MGFLKNKWFLIGIAVGVALLAIASRIAATKSYVDKVIA